MYPFSLLYFFFYVFLQIVDIHIHIIVPGLATFPGDFRPFAKTTPCISTLSGRLKPVSDKSGLPGGVNDERRETRAFVASRLTLAGAPTMREDVLFRRH